MMRRRRRALLPRGLPELAKNQSQLGLLPLLLLVRLLRLLRALVGPAERTSSKAGGSGSGLGEEVN